MSGGSGGNDVGSASAKVKASSARELQANSEGGRAAYLQQVLSSMQGNKGAIPGVKSLMAGTELGRSSAIADTEALANKTGLTSAQGRAITAPMSIRGADTTANTSDALMEQYQAAAPGLAVQPTLLAQQGLGGAVQRAGANKAAKKAADDAAITAGASAAASIAAGVAVSVISAAI